MAKSITNLQQPLNKPKLDSMQAGAHEQPKHLKDIEQQLNKGMQQPVGIVSVKKRSASSKEN